MAVHFPLQWCIKFIKHDVKKSFFHPDKEHYIWTQFGVLGINLTRTTCHEVSSANTREARLCRRVPATWSIVIIICYVYNKMWLCSADVIPNSYATATESYLVECQTEKRTFVYVFYICYCCIDILLVRMQKFLSRSI